jgi:hypothetical protein
MMTMHRYDTGRRRLAVWIGLLVLVSATGAGATVAVERFDGVARNEAGQIEYVEKHVVIYRENRVHSSRTTYFDPQNRLIGELQSDYSEGYQFGSYDFVDLRGGLKNGAKVEGDLVRMYTQKDGGRAVETKVIPRVSNQIVGQGFHHFIVNNLEAIAAGKMLHVRMVLPAQLDDFKFRIRRSKIEEDVISIRLEIDHWFLRLFAPHVDTDYHLPSKRLLRYEGLSNLKDPSGAYKVVTISYEYHS